MSNKKLCISHDVIQLDLAQFTDDLENDLFNETSHLLGLGELKMQLWSSFVMSSVLDEEPKHAVVEAIMERLCHG